MLLGKVYRLACSAEDLVLCGDAVEFAFQALVFGEEGGGLGVHGLELDFEVFDVAFFAFAEGALAYTCRQLMKGWSVGVGEEAYAALFWALRRLWAGVRFAPSLSSSPSLLRPCSWV